MAYPDENLASTLFALGDQLTIADVVGVARDRRRVTPLPPGVERVEASAAWVAGTLAERPDGSHPPAYYGINTGFGDNAGRAAFQHVEQAEQLSRNLLLSHCIGVGPHLPEDAVRAALLIRAASLAHGYSGIRREVINTLVAMLNADVYPAVPSQGSLGASGDLAPLAHLVIPLSATLPGEDLTRPGASLTPDIAPDESHRHSLGDLACIRRPNRVEIVPARGQGMEVAAIGVDGIDIRRVTIVPDHRDPALRGSGSRAWPRNSRTRSTVKRVRLLCAR